MFIIKRRWCALVIYVLHGEDSFSATEALRELLEAVGPEDVRSSNVSELEAREFSVDKLAAAAMVVPFLADRRAVVVRGLMGTAEGSQRRGGRQRQDGAQARPPTELSALLGELPPTSDVVFFEGRLSPANPFLKAVAEAGDGQVRVREFAPLRRDALAAWVSERAAQKGGEIDRRTASMLAEQIGPNLWVMDSELEKLTIYCDGRPIGEDDVKALVSSTKDANVFALVDAIMEHRTGAALNSMRQLLDEGAAGAVPAHDGGAAGTDGGARTGAAGAQGAAAGVARAAGDVVRFRGAQDDGPGPPVLTGSRARAVPSVAGDRRRAEDGHVGRVGAHGDAGAHVGAAIRGTCGALGRAIAPLWYPERAR